MKALKFLIASVSCALANPALAQSDEITAEMVEHADGTRTLVHEAVVDAPVSAVWATLSTAEGWKKWGPRFAWFDLRHGGTIETGYHTDAVRGDPRNIIHRIIAFVPDRMIALQVIQAPEGGPADAETVKQVWGVYELEPVTETKTRLRISGIGYGTDDASSRILEFFKTGNAYSIELMKKNLAASLAEVGE